MSKAGKQDGIWCVVAVENDHMPYLHLAYNGWRNGVYGLEKWAEDVAMDEIAPNVRIKVSPRKGTAEVTAGGELIARAQLSQLAFGLSKAEFEALFDREAQP